MIPGKLPASSFEWHAQVCRKKIKYHSKTIAKDWARRFQKIFHNKSRVYKCQICGQFHLCSVATEKSG